MMMLPIATHNVNLCGCILFRLLPTGAFSDSFKLKSNNVFFFHQINNKACQCMRPVSSSFGIPGAILSASNASKTTGK